MTYTYPTLLAEVLALIIKRRVSFSNYVCQTGQVKPQTATSTPCRWRGFSYDPACHTLRLSPKHRTAQRILWRGASDEDFFLETRPDQPFCTPGNEGHACSTGRTHKLYIKRCLRSTSLSRLPFLGIDLLLVVVHRQSPLNTHPRGLCRERPGLLRLRRTCLLGVVCGVSVLCK